MTKASADIFGPAPNAADIVIAIDSGLINAAPLMNGTIVLPFTGGTLTIPAGQLANGGNVINVPIVFAPGDPDANITVASGPATVNAPATLDATLTPAGINVFGT